MRGFFIFRRVNWFIPVACVDTSIFKHLHTFSCIVTVQHQRQFCYIFLNCYPWNQFPISKSKLYALKQPGKLITKIDANQLIITGNFPSHNNIVYSLTWKTVEGVPSSVFFTGSHSKVLYNVLIVHTSMYLLGAAQRRTTAIPFKEF